MPHRDLVVVIGRRVQLSYRAIDGIIHNPTHVHGRCPFCGGDLTVLLCETPQRWICRTCLRGGDASKFLEMLLRGEETEPQRGLQCDLSDSGIPGRND